MLTDKELEELGVKTIGDRATLRKRCHEGPQQYVAYSPSASSFSSLSGSELPRKNKRKGKYQLEIQKPKKRSSAVTFEKKLYAFNYKGPDAPDTFTCSDKDIVMRGLLPQISVSATENEV